MMMTKFNEDRLYKRVQYSEGQSKGVKQS